MIIRIYILLFTLAFLPACALFETPGVGKKADEGYAACAPIIEALAAYRKSHGDYPKKLKDLKPKFLKKIPEKVGEYPIDYDRKSKDDFTLDFSYEDHGVNNCDYTPLRKWKCYGFY